MSQSLLLKEFPDPFKDSLPTTGPLFRPLSHSQLTDQRTSCHTISIASGNAVLGFLFGWLVGWFCFLETGSLCVALAIL